jgi:Xaa-Pro aminopeptidase
LFVVNRANLKRLLLPNSLAVVNANDVLPTNADGTFLLKQSTDLFYLTGIEQEESLLLLYPDAHDEKHREILFLRQPNPNFSKPGKAISSPSRGAARFPASRGSNGSRIFRPLFHRLMCECDHAYLNSNEHKRAHIVVETREARFVKETQAKYPLHRYCNGSRRCCINCAPSSPRSKSRSSRRRATSPRRAFGASARSSAPASTRWKWRPSSRANSSGAAGSSLTIPSSPPAPTLAPCIICRTINRVAGQLLLLDVAASYANYNADLTRTIPVNGKFTKRQKQVYNAVLRVLRAVSQAAVPGKLPKDWQTEAEAFIEKELVDLKLLKLSDLKKQTPDNKAFRKYFMHGVGHPLGLDVHDLGLTTGPIQQGWVLTVEPGIYLQEEGFAVRLENDILVQDGGNKDLMGHIPIETDDIELLMNR